MQANATTTQATHPARVLLTVNQFAEQQPGLTPGGIRWDLFQRRDNGLSESGAVIRRGRRLLLDPAKYLEWMEDRSNEYA